MEKSELENMVEPLARLMAAETMGLVKDSQGLRLPSDLWQQKIPAARGWLGI
jgi:hypothetical protein